jgi:hypothetical protein
MPVSKLPTLIRYSFVYICMSEEKNTYWASISYFIYIFFWSKYTLKISFDVCAYWNWVIL